MILRRYRQFAALHAAIVKRYGEKDLPHFPKKRLLGNMNPSLVEKRRRKLENYLTTIATFPGIEDFLAFTTFLVRFISFFPSNLFPALTNSFITATTV